MYTFGAVSTEWFPMVWRFPLHAHKPVAWFVGPMHVHAVLGLDGDVELAAPSAAQQKVAFVGIDEYSGK